MLSYVGNNPATLSDPSGHFLPLLVIAGAALLGAAAYTVGVGVANTLQGNTENVMQGWNPVDAAISAVATATGGLLVAAGLTGAGLYIASAVIGFDATLASMAAGGRSDPGELVGGTIVGAFGPRLPGGKGLWGFVRGAVSGGLVNALQTIIGSGGQSSRDGVPSKSRALSGAQ